MTKFIVLQYIILQLSEHHHFFFFIEQSKKVPLKNYRKMKIRDLIVSLKMTFSASKNTRLSLPKQKQLQLISICVWNNFRCSLLRGPKLTEKCLSERLIFVIPAYDYLLFALILRRAKFTSFFCLWITKIHRNAHQHKFIVWIVVSAKLNNCPCELLLFVKVV